MAINLVLKEADDLTESEREILKFIDDLTENRISISTYLLNVKFLRKPFEPEQKRFVAKSEQPEKEKESRPKSFEKVEIAVPEKIDTPIEKEEKIPEKKQTEVKEEPKLIPKEKVESGRKIASKPQEVKKLVKTPTKIAELKPEIIIPKITIFSSNPKELSNN